MTVLLPGAGGGVEPYTVGPPLSFPSPAGPALSRVAYAAAHVVADPLADTGPGGPAELDWEATMAYRHHLWRLGLGVAEAMDTAQRGMGLDWPAAAELIRRSGAEARVSGGRLACGAGTDQLADRADVSLDDVLHAYEDQVAVVEDAGAQVVVMASRALAHVARDADDYRYVYGRLLDQVRQPAILHWLGAPFDPTLAGYWGSSDLNAATDTLIGLVKEHADRIDGVKVSLLDRAHEIDFRRQLPVEPTVRLYTGDDLHYPELIAGDELGHSDALLGVFDAIAPPAAAALAAIDAGDVTGFHDWLDPTVPLARHIFGPPTAFYKVGLVFLAWLAGHQRHFCMVAGLQSARSVRHLAEVFTLADRAGLLPDPPLAASRMRAYLTLAGVWA